MQSAPVARTRSRTPSRESRLIAGAWKICVDSVSRGNVARSTTATRTPCRASSAASGDPAQRAPTTITSKFSAIYTPLLRSIESRRIPDASLYQHHRVGERLRSLTSQLPRRGLTRTPDLPARTAVNCIHLEQIEILDLPASPYWIRALNERWWVPVGLSCC